MLVASERNQAAEISHYSSGVAAQLKNELANQKRLYRVLVKT